ncbi:uncharacterized protein LOC100184243 [Ciona intestinalis]
MSSSSKDNLKGTIQEFALRFQDDLAEVEAVDDKLKLHARTLTNCYKLLCTEPEAESVLTLWATMIRFTLKLMLNLKDPPTKVGLNSLNEFTKPWIVDQNFQGTQHELVHQIYKLSVDGPWSHPLLQDMLQHNTTPEQLKDYFDDERLLMVHRFQALCDASKIDECLLFSRAVMLHSQATSNILFHRCYQNFCIRRLSSEDLEKQFQYFNFEVTCQVIDSLLTTDKKIGLKLCNSAMEYMWTSCSTENLPEMSYKWCQVTAEQNGLTELYDIIMKQLINGEKKLSTVRQCVGIATSLRNLDPDNCRVTCVEVLFHALHVLNPHETNSQLLKEGILSSIAYFLPDSLIARACSLTVFISNPTPEHYFEVAKIHKTHYNKEKDTSIDCTAQLRFELLEYLKRNWPPKFLSSHAYDWLVLRKVCLETMSSDDAAIVQQVEHDQIKTADSSGESGSEAETDTSMEDTSHNEDIAPPSEETNGVRQKSETELQPLDGSVEGCSKPDNSDVIMGVVMSHDLNNENQESWDQNNHEKEAGVKNHEDHVVNENTHDVKMNESHSVDMEGVNEDVYVVNEKDHLVNKEDHDVNGKDHVGNADHDVNSDDQVVNIETHDVNLETHRVNSEDSNVSSKDHVVNEIHMNEVDHVVNAEDHAMNAEDHAMNAEDHAMNAEDHAMNESGNNELSQVEQQQQQQCLVESEANVEEMNQNMDNISPKHTTRLPVTSQPPNTPPAQIWVCPKESCQRIIRSKQGMSNHLGRKHRWSQSEITVYYNSLKQDSASARSRRNNKKTADSTQKLDMDNSHSDTNGKTTSSENLQSYSNVESFSKPVIPSLPVILPSVVASADAGSIQKEKEVEKVEENLVLELKCPVETCDRVFRHKHTIQAHLEFRHKMSAKKATEMSEKAEIIEKPPPPPKPQSSSSTKPTFDDISTSKGWFWPVDDFLFQELDEVLIHKTSYNRKKYSNLRASLTRDVMCLFGSAPLSFDLTLAQNNIENIWEMTSKLENNEPTLSVPEEPTEAEVNQDLFDFPLHTEPIVEEEPPNTPDPIPKLSEMKPLLNMKVKIKAPVKVTHKKKTKPATHFTVASQTFFHPHSKFFTPSDHYHHLAIKKSSKPLNHVNAQTVFSGFLGVPSRTYAVQCCQESLVVPRYKTMKLKKRSLDYVDKISSVDQPHVTTEPPTQPVAKIKRKYDAQTVYNMADKYPSIYTDTPIIREESSAFGDALNYNSFAKIIADSERLIEKKKSSHKTKEGHGVSDAQKSSEDHLTKKVKKHRTSSRSEVSPKRGKLKSSEVGEISKAKTSDQVDILPHRAGYQELLKKAEEISSAGAKHKMKQHEGKSGRKRSVTSQSKSEEKKREKEPKTPPSMEKNVSPVLKKSTVVKRTIDLRKLSSSSSGSKDVKREDSASPVGGAVAKKKTKVETIPEKIICPECKRQMINLFALTCHMRKKHKGNARKLFIPKQNDNKMQKNLNEPPVLNEAYNKQQVVVDNRMAHKPNASHAPDTPTTPKDNCFEVEFVNGKMLCPYSGCSLKYKHRRSLTTHFKVKHPQFHKKLLWKKIVPKSAEPLSPNKDFIYDVIKDHLNPILDAESAKVPPLEAALPTGDSLTEASSVQLGRRHAYTTANIQIQMCSSDPFRQMSSAQELACLYNKRIQRKIALALPCAQNSAPTSFKMSMSPVHLNFDSDDSTDSFDTDYNPQLPCWLCQELFHRRKNLITHIQYHLRQIYNYQHKCNFVGCLYAFRSAEDLKNHRSRHGRNHICLFCPHQSRSFKSASNLILHEHDCHKNLKLDLPKLRRQFYAHPFKVEPNISKLLMQRASQKPDSDSDSSDDCFLTSSHRGAPCYGGVRTNKQCKLCANNGIILPSASVAKHCEHSIIKETADVLADMILCVEEYILTPHVPMQSNAPTTSVSDSPPTTPPVSAPPPPTPPVSAPPPPTPPVSAPPPTTPPVSAPPPTTPPVSAPPPTTPPVSSPPPTTPPVSSPPPTTPPVSAPPPTTSPVSAPPPTTSPVSAPPPTSPHVSAPPPTTPHVSSTPPPTPPVSSPPPTSPPVSAPPPTTPSVSAPPPTTPLVSAPPPPTPPVSAPSPTTPPVSAPPPTTPPVSAPSPTTPPVSAPPPTTPLVSAPPPPTPPVSAPSPTTPPVSAPPPTTPPVSAFPPTTPYLSAPPPTTPYLNAPPPPTPPRPSPPTPPVSAPPPTTPSVSAPPPTTPPVTAPPVTAPPVTAPPPTTPPVTAPPPTTPPVNALPPLTSLPPSPLFPPPPPRAWTQEEEDEIAFHVDDLMDMMICQAEIKEQADFLINADIVPCGVLYYDRDELEMNPFTTVSVFGHRTDGHLSIQLAMETMKNMKLTDEEFEAKYADQDAPYPPVVVEDDLVDAGKDEAKIVELDCSSPEKNLREFKVPLPPVGRRTSQSDYSVAVVPFSNVYTQQSREDNTTVACCKVGDLPAPIDQETSQSDYSTAVVPYSNVFAQQSREDNTTGACCKVASDDPNKEPMINCPWEMFQDLKTSFLPIRPIQELPEEIRPLYCRYLVLPHSSFEFKVPEMTIRGGFPVSSDYERLCSFCLDRLQGEETKVDEKDEDVAGTLDLEESIDVVPDVAEPSDDVCIDAEIVKDVAKTLDEIVRSVDAEVAVEVANQEEQMEDEKEDSVATNSLVEVDKSSVTVEDNVGIIDSNDERKEIDSTDNSEVKSEEQSVKTAEADFSLTPLEQDFYDDFIMGMKMSGKSDNAILKVFRFRGRRQNSVDYIRGVTKKNRTLDEIVAFCDDPNYKKVKQMSQKSSVKDKKRKSLSKDLKKLKAKMMITDGDGKDVAPVQISQDSTSENARAEQTKSAPKRVRKTSESSSKKRKKSLCASSKGVLVPLVERMVTNMSDLVSQNNEDEVHKNRVSPQESVRHHEYEDNHIDQTDQNIHIVQNNQFDFMNQNKYIEQTNQNNHLGFTNHYIGQQSHINHVGHSNQNNHTVEANQNNHVDNFDQNKFPSSTDHSYISHAETNNQIFSVESRNENYQPDDSYLKDGHDPIVDHNEAMLHHNEPLMQHNEPLLHHKEPILHHKERFLHHKEPVVHHKEPLLRQNEPLMQHNGPLLHHIPPFIHHNDTYDKQICPVCKLHLAGADQFIKHLKICHILKKKNFPCIFTKMKCLFSFSTPIELHNHIGLHEGSHPFPCIFCTMWFANLCDMNLHMRNTHAMLLEKFKTSINEMKREKRKSSNGQTNVTGPASTYQKKFENFMEQKNSSKPSDSETPSKMPHDLYKDAATSGSETSLIKPNNPPMNITDAILKERCKSIIKKLQKSPMPKNQKFVLKLEEFMRNESKNPQQQQTQHAKLPMASSTDTPALNTSTPAMSFNNKAPPPRSLHQINIQLPRKVATQALIKPSLKHITPQRPFTDVLLSNVGPRVKSCAVVAPFCTQPINNHPQSEDRGLNLPSISLLSSSLQSSSFSFPSTTHSHQPTSHSLQSSHSHQPTSHSLQSSHSHQPTSHSLQSSHSLLPPSLTQFPRLHAAPLFGQRQLNPLTQTTPTQPLTPITQASFLTRSPHAPITPQPTPPHHPTIITVKPKSTKQITVPKKNAFMIKRTTPNEGRLFLDMDQLHEDQPSYSVYNCSFCTNMYGSKLSWKDHVLEDHGLYLCILPSCHRAFGTKELLNKHEQIAHANVDQVCETVVISDDEKDEFADKWAVRQVWESNDKLAQSVIWKGREKLVQATHDGLQDPETLNIICTEIKAYALRCCTRNTSTGDSYKQCPVLNCNVLGGSQELYHHFMSQHKLVKIFDWTKRRMKNLLKQRAMNKEKKLKQIAMFANRDQTNINKVYDVIKNNEPIVTQQSNAACGNNVWVVGKSVDVMQNTVEVMQHCDVIIEESAEVIIEENADVVETNDIVVQSACKENADVINKNADVIQKNADVIQKNADVVINNADVINKNADVIQKTADVAVCESEVNITTDTEDGFQSKSKATLSQIPLRNTENEGPATSTEDIVVTETSNEKVATLKCSVYINQNEHELANAHLQQVVRINHHNPTDWTLVKLPHSTQRDEPCVVIEKLCLS